MRNELDQTSSSDNHARGRNSPLQITVHDREEDLEEQVDGVDQHRQQIEPRFAGHDGHETNDFSRIEKIPMA